MVIYAVLAEQLIISLYVAAIVPSVLAIALHFSAIATYTPGGHPNSSTRGHPKLLHPEQM